MSLWLVRAGSGGEFEQRFLEDKCIYFTWDELDRRMPDSDNLKDFRDLFAECVPWLGEKQAIGYAAQGRMFSRRIQEGDWVVLPSKFSPTLHFGKITGEYEFDKGENSNYMHSRKVDWFALDIPRDRFDQDILYSLGASSSIAQIQRNDAEKRVKAMAEHDWKSQNQFQSPSPQAQTAQSEGEEEVSEEETRNLSEIAEDAISKHIIAKFKGHRMETLVAAVLEAEGYHVLPTPKGADGGVDILAAPGGLGFGAPKLCVQVKSTDATVGRETLDQLIGVMQRYEAENGILVSWSGFKSTLLGREGATHFFKVRLWDRDDLLKRIYQNYDKLPVHIRADIPLEQIWVLEGQAAE